MSIRNSQNGFPSRFRIKADQHWEMAGLARQDGDLADSARHTEQAREYERLAAEDAEA